MISKITFTGLWIFLLLLCSSPFVQSMVDMRNSNFSRTWVDYESKGNPLLKVSRSYRSRSLFNGFFGFGWCSNYEDRLEVNPEKNRLMFKECGDGQEVEYRKGKNKAQGSSSFVMSFYSVEGGISRIVKTKDGGYIRFLSNGDQQKFNSEGVFIRFENTYGNYIVVQYDKQKCLDKVIDNKGRYLDFTCKKNKIGKITTHDRKRMTYQFRKYENLTLVKVDKRVFKYRYDKLHNMEQGTYPDGKTTFSATYNSERDWIKSFTDGQGCVEKYDYRVSKSSPLLRHSNTVKKYCKNKLVIRKNYDFWYKKRKNKLYLSRMRVRVDGLLESDTSYHSEFRLPASIKKPGRKVTYSYFPNGLVKIKKEGKNEYHFGYGKKSRKIERMDHFVIDKKGRRKKYYWVAAKVVKGKRRAIFDSRGFHLSIRNDEKGRISQLADQAKRVVHITYDKDSFRPDILRRPGMGSVRISYRANGEIKDIESNAKGDDKLIVTTQILQIFNQFLELNNYLDLGKIYII